MTPAGGDLSDRERAALLVAASQARAAMRRNGEQIAAAFEAVDALAVPWSPGAMIASLSQFARVASATNQAVEAGLRASVDAIARHFEGVREVVARSLEWLTPQLLEVGRLAAATYASHAPSNWSEVPFRAALDLVCRRGLPLIDVPSAHVVAAFVAAEEDGLDPLHVLDSHRDAIIESVADIAREAVASPDPGLARRGAHLAEVAAALRSGLDRVALVAASAWSEPMLREFVDDQTSRYGVLVERFRVDGDILDDLDFRYFRPALVVHCVVANWRTFFAKSDEPVPELLSRHAAVHSYDPLQYSARNAVWAALVLANLIACQLRGPELEDEWRLTRDWDPTSRGR